MVLAAAASLGEAVLHLRAEDSQMQGDINSAKGTAMQSLGSLGKSMQRTGAVMTAGVTLPLVGIGLASIDMASDVEESRNKVDVVFEGMASQIKDFSATAGTALGLSEKSALEMTGTFGSMFNTMGLGGEETADMSLKLTQLAADYASFHNLKPEEAFDKIRAGMVGSSEPLQGLGKDLRAGAVQAYAFQNGLAATKEELTPMVLAQARFGLLMQQSSKETGDFARTSDGLANSTRIMKAELANASAELGVELLPLMLELVHAALDILHAFKEADPQFKKTIVVIGGIAAAVGPVLTVLGTLFTFISSVSGAMGALGISGGSVGTVLAALTGPVGLLIGAVILLGVTIAVFGKDAWNTIKMLYAIVKTIFMRIVTTIGGSFRKVKEMVIGSLTSIGTRIRQIFNMDWGAIGRNVIQGIANGIRNGIDAVRNAARDAANSALQAAKNFLGIHSPSERFRAEVGVMMGAGIEEGFVDSMSGVQRGVAGGLSTVSPAAMGAAGGGRGGVTFQVVYQPFMSTADRYEAEERLLPLFRNLARQL